MGTNTKEAGKMVRCPVPASIAKPTASAMRVNTRTANLTDAAVRTFLTEIEKKEIGKKATWSI